MKKSKNEAIELAQFINYYLDHYLCEHKTDSLHTIRAYKTTMDLYIRFLESHLRISSTSFNRDSFSRQNIEKWLEWLKHERKCSAETCNNRLACLRSFLQFLSQQDVKYLSIYLEATTIARRKTKKKKITGLTKEAVKELLHTPNQTTKIGRRDAALLMTLYSTAARIDEILSLRLENLYLDHNKPYISVVGKGNKARTLYLPPQTAAHLKQYLNEFHPNSDQSAYVFYSRVTGLHGKMTQPAVAKILKKYAAIAHEKNEMVPLDLHAHQFRHAKASHWLEDGMNIVQISFLLGHEQLETTMIYLDISNDQKARALATLEEEEKKETKAKWKGKENSLRKLCGLE